VHPVLLDSQGLSDFQEATGPHEVVHGHCLADLCRSSRFDVVFFVVLREASALPLGFSSQPFVHGLRD
jgi:hypothetical protein